MKNNDFVSHGRSVSDLKAHLVLTTKYRRKVLTGKMLERLHEIFIELLEKWDCKCISFDGERDHCHLLFQYHPDIQISKVVTSLKSVSSRKIRQEFSKEVNEVYYKNVFWSSSYFIASCGGVTISVLKKYIENQETPQ